MVGKISSGIMLTLLLTVMFVLVLDTQSAKAEPTTIVVPDDYSTIQEAVDAADPRDTIYVRAGTYLEHVSINKGVFLLGENRITTIVDGEPRGTVIHVDASNVIISGFTIQNGDYGIYIDDSESVHISDNHIVNCGFASPQAGIAVYLSHNVTISNNGILGSSRIGTAGIYLASTVESQVNGNNVSYFHSGIYVFSYSNSNVISNNVVTYNNVNNLAGWLAFNNTYFGNTEYGTGLYSIDYSGYGQYIGNNKFFHNNLSGMNVLPGNSNVWDDGYPSGGNYWSTYSDVDLFRGPNQDESGSDGIWDNPLVIDSNNVDRYPFTQQDGWEVTTYLLTINSAMGGTTVPTAGSYTYGEDEVATVTATPDVGYYFDHWDYNGHTSTTNPIMITMNQDYTLTPVFVYSGPSVPEFPIGLALEILFVPVIIYMLWRSKRRKKVLL